MQVVLNSRTGETGDLDAWVGRFAELWRGGSANAGRFMDLLSPEVLLVAPGLRPTRGRAAGLEAFRRTFRVLPDLTGEVHHWSASGGVLYVEMSFAATIAGRRLEWRNIDRFRFLDGVAVERVAYYDSGRLRRAFLRRPSGWVQLLRRVTSGL